MPRGDAKPIIRMKSINANKSQKLSGFFDYLTQPGHQTENDEIPEVYTNLEDSSVVGIKDFLDQYEKNFQSAKKSGDLKNNCKLLAKSMVFMLPYGMTKKEIDGYVKAITDTLPDYMTFAFAVHRGSNKKTRDSHKNLHLQGFLGIRGRGAEKFGPDVRIPLHENLILAANDYIKSLKFKIAFNPVRTRPCKASLKFLEAEAMTSALQEGVSGNRDVKSRQSELLRDPMWLFEFSQRQDVTDERLKQFCAECAQKRIRIDAEKCATTAGSYGLKFEQQLADALRKKETAQAGASKLATAQVKIALLPRQYDANHKNNNAEKHESDSATYQPLTEDMLKAALNECKKSTLKDIKRI